MSGGRVIKPATGWSGIQFRAVLFFPLLSVRAQPNSHISPESSLHSSLLPEKEKKIVCFLYYSSSFFFLFLYNTEDMRCSKTDGYHLKALIGPPTLAHYLSLETTKSTSTNLKNRSNKAIN